jgi:MFS transporter, DHA1 family, tetracycline resistance protein
MRPTSFRFTAFCLMLAIIIDIMGIGLVFPLLPSLFMGEHAAFLMNAQNSSRELFYGLSIGVWALGLFFGTPFLGDVSDQIGRKKALVICLALVGVSYLFSAVSITYSSLSLFMLSRLMSGFFGASFPLAQAAFVDLSTPENRTRNISFVTLAASVGIIIGPLLSAVSLKLSEGALALKLPFLLAALLSFLNALAIYMLLQETFTPKLGVKPNLLSAVKACNFMFVDQRVRLLSFVFFLLCLAWGFYIEGLPMILAKGYGFSSVEISLCYVLFGLSCGLQVLVVQPYVLKRMSLKTMFSMGAILITLIFFLLGFYHNGSWQIVGIFWVQFFELFAYTANITLISKAVTDYEQGKALGATGAIFGLSWTLIAPLIGHLLSINMDIPLYLAAFCAFLAFILMIGYKPYVAAEN